MADSSNPAPAVQAPSSSSSTMTWRKISLPLPHLFPHLTINLRGHLPPARPSSPPPTGGAGSAAAPVTKAKTGRDWKLRRQKTYDSPGCLNAAASAGAPPLAGKPPPHRPASVVANDSTANVPVSKSTHKREKEKNETGNFADTLSPFPKPEGEKNFALVSLAQRLLENKVEDEE
ncbi:hypothetical protein DAPPUDRAFT_222879 [Daphnia pulex]|uniref:Uncharacterized protein n=1 Tax=Daphnia pulex TaxID=6669 RepID=E9G6W7_DAPPU|nr:hypothetical protein DAPPUDRAFT_222879 [Daphnia pulex]|eukprot:EFX84742.1 hypothetical protein DAPPUDRAFT_222879 [Daphnia pulex]